MSLCLEGIKKPDDKPKKLPSPLKYEIYEGKKTPSTEEKEKYLKLNDEQIAYLKNLLSLEKYQKYNPLLHSDPSLVDPRDLSYEDP